MINDISAGTHDPAMLGTIAELGSPVVLMHISANFPADPSADDVNILENVARICGSAPRRRWRRGIRAERILLDPGIGFGKTVRNNMRWCLVCQPDLPFPLVLGLSRKRFLTLLDATCRPGFEVYRRAIETVADLATPLPLVPAPAHEGDLHTAVLTAYQAARPLCPHGLIHRVHDVMLAGRAICIGQWRNPVPNRRSPCPDPKSNRRHGLQTSTK